MAILWGLLWALGGLVALLLLLLLLILFLPFAVHLRFDADWAAPTWADEMNGTIRWLLRLRWGGGMVDGLWEGQFLTRNYAAVRFCGLGRRNRSEREKTGTEDQKRKHESKRKPRRKRKSGPPDLSLIQAFAVEAARFLGRLVRDAGIGIRGDMTYGFSDPAVTGWCEAFRGFTQLPLPFGLEPDFTRSVLAGWIQVDGCINLFGVLRAAWPALDNTAIRAWLADRIRFKPVHYWFVRGGKRTWRTSS